MESQKDRDIHATLRMSFHSQIKASVNIRLTLLSLPTVNVKVVSREPLHFFPPSSVTFANVNLQIASRDVLRATDSIPVVIRRKTGRRSKREARQDEVKIESSKRENHRGGGTAECANRAIHSSPYETTARTDARSDATLA